MTLRRSSSDTLPGTATAAFLEAAIVEGKRYEEAVAQDLSAVVFERVFPRLVTAIAAAAGEGAGLSEVRSAALIFLYRLLFLLYAEDRGLLPVNDARYDDYGLRRRVRDEVSRRMAAGDTFSAAARRSPGTRSSAATCAPTSTPSISTSTACPARTPPTSSTPSRSSAARIRPHAAATAPATSSSPT